MDKMGRWQAALLRSVRWPRLLAVEERCNDLPSFQNARPEAQPDAE